MTLLQEVPAVERQKQPAQTLSLRTAPVVEALCRQTEAALAAEREEASRREALLAARRRREIYGAD